MPTWLARTCVVLGVVVGAYLVFELGRIQAGYNLADAAAEKRELQAEIALLEDDIVALKEQIALLETHRDIDRAAYKDVELSLAELQRKIQEQRDAIEFYRGIVSPKDGGRGLRVQDLKLEKGGEEGLYNVRLVLVQVKQHDRSVRGEVDFRIEGAQDGEARTYTLAELMPEAGDGNWNFQFRYFQDFDRQLVLPEGFTPERINIEVKSRTKSVASVKESFAWETTPG